MTADTKQLRALLDAALLKMASEHGIRSAMDDIREVRARLSTHAGESSTATVAAAGAETAPLPAPAPAAGDAGGVVEYLLRQLVQVKGPANTVMWESPDGKGGQFADKGVALMCWLNRAALPALSQQPVDINAGAVAMHDMMCQGTSGRWDALPEFRKSGWRKQAIACAKAFGVAIKPYCLDCRATGVWHCAHPEECGGMVYPALPTAPKQEGE